MNRGDGYRREYGRREFPGRRRRPGNSLLEVQVAFALLGIGLAGLSQLVVMQIRQVRVLENRLQPHLVQASSISGASATSLPGQTYYLVPWQNRWTRKFAGAAQIVAGSSTIPGDPVFQLSGQAAPSYQITIQELSAADSNQTVTATVQLTAS